MGVRLLVHFSQGGSILAFFVLCKYVSIWDMRARGLFQLICKMLCKWFFFCSSIVCIMLEVCFFACRCIKGEPAIEEYYEMYSEAEEYSKKISDEVMQSPVAQQYLTPGRVVVVKSQSVSTYLWCVLDLQVYQLLKKCICWYTVV